MVNTSWQRAASELWSPDLSQIGNLCRTEDMNDGEEAFQTKILQIEARDEWSKIPEEMYKTLVASYTNCVTAVREHKEFPIDY